MYVCGRESIQNIFVQNHRFGEKPTRSRMSLRPSGTIEPSAVDDRSFTGVASMGKLLQHESKIKNQSTPFPMPCGGNDRRYPLVSNFPINNDFEVEFWMLGVTRVNLDRRPTKV